MTTIIPIWRCPVCGLDYHDREDIGDQCEDCGYEWGEDDGDPGYDPYDHYYDR